MEKQSNLVYVSLPGWTKPKKVTERGGILVTATLRGGFYGDVWLPKAAVVDVPYYENMKQIPRRLAVEKGMLIFETFVPKTLEDLRASWDSAVAAYHKICAENGETPEPMPYPELYYTTGGAYDNL